MHRIVIIFDLINCQFEMKKKMFDTYLFIVMLKSRDHVNTKIIVIYTT